MQLTRNCWVESQLRAQALGKLLTGILCVRAGADTCTQVPVPEAGRADHVSDVPENRTHTAPPASVLVAEPRFPKQVKQGLASSAAVCGTLHDCGIVLEFRIPLLQKRKNSLDDMRVPRDRETTLKMRAFYVSLGPVHDPE